MTADSRWNDLGTRLLTGGVLSAGGVVVVALGGPVFLFVASLAAGILIWELTRLVAPEVNNRAVIFALLSALALAMAAEFETPWAIGLAVLPALLGLITLRARRWIFFVFALGIQGAAYELTIFRDLHGIVWLVWLIFIVVATDIAGYFAGRSIGGPRFWPRVSPKKTWAGVVAGWAASAALGAAFVAFTGAGFAVIVLSVMLSFAAQMGDIAESALKRHVGVKDSSDLLPGHGGLFDRFDGLLGASIFMLVVAQITPTPGLV